jgi:Ser-tRNA(Ala) deacylase AlaX
MSNEPIENGVQIENLRSKSNTTSDVKGDFSFFVQVGDTLQFSASTIATFKKVLTKSDLEKRIYVVEIKTGGILLKEVEILNYKNINAVSLGILQKQPKSYTPAERRLYGATSSPIDALLNMFSGRTSNLKDIVEIEKKELLIKKLLLQFEETYFIEKLKIPEDYVIGFLYFAAENKELLEIEAINNKALTQFKLTAIAANYLEIINEKQQK